MSSSIRLQFHFNSCDSCLLPLVSCYFNEPIRASFVCDRYSLCRPLRLWFHTSCHKCIRMPWCPNQVFCDTKISLALHLLDVSQLMALALALAEFQALLLVDQAASLSFLVSESLLHATGNLLRNYWVESSHGTLVPSKSEAGCILSTQIGNFARNTRLLCLGDFQILPDHVQSLTLSLCSLLDTGHICSCQSLIKRGTFCWDLTRAIVHLETIGRPVSFQLDLQLFISTNSFSLRILESAFMKFVFNFL